ncbi:MAG TPA: glycosyltransferase family 39 protein [Candidatus Binatia bacterium]|nr:glycosyltransferase family 39 protein [Candidatus Binatia bacterium]
MSTSSADRLLLAACAAVAVFALVARIHDVAAYPAIYDYDAGGHAVYVVDLLELHLPNVRSWCGSHPPLYHAIGALLCALLPESIPVHVMLRLVSVGAWMITVGLVWRTLRRLGSEVDAAVVGTLLLGIPGVIIATSMMTNDALSGLFVTATLVRLVEAPDDERRLTRHAGVTAVLAGLAAMAKATGVAAIGMAAAFYAWRSRRTPSRALRSVVVVALVAAAVAGTHYARLFFSLSGSAYHILGARAGSQEKEVIGAVVNAVAPTRRLFPSLPGLLHASLWGDPMAVFLPRDLRASLDLMSIAGWIVTLVAVAGAVRLLLRREVARGYGVVLLFGLLYAGALLPLVSVGPYVVLTKTNYMLPEALPLGVVLAAGMGALRNRLGAALRAALVTVAAAGIALTWYGWWDPSRSVAQPTASVDASAVPASLVRRYFAHRADDPIRALRLLDPEVHRAHELRLVRILRVPFGSEGELAPEDERSLELARARVAWLELYNLVRWMQPVAAQLDVTVLEATEERETAEVNVRIGPRGTTAPPGTPGIGRWPFPAFEQRFRLRRDAAGWRITSVDQRGVTDDNAVQAFVAHPTLAALDRLRALGWRPSWEAAVALVFPPAS